jgi:hypothetical protein
MVIVVGGGKVTSVATKITTGTLVSFISKVKGKAIPLQALTGPEGSRSLRLPDFKTFST